MNIQQYDAELERRYAMYEKLYRECKSEYRERDLPLALEWLAVGAAVALALGILWAVMG